MSTITLMIATGPALSLLLVSVALLPRIVRRKHADGARLTLLRGLIWSFGAALAAYLGAEAAFLAHGNFQGFTLTTCLPVVVFSAAAAAAIWHIRNLKLRVAVAGKPTTTTR